MDRPIQVGDLVQVVRPCCSAYGGNISVVSNIESDSIGWHCTKCQAEDGGGTYAELNFGKGFGWLPLHQLKRIPPLDELEGERTEENLKEKV